MLIALLVLGTLTLITAALAAAASLEARNTTTLLTARITDELGGIQTTLRRWHLGSISVTDLERLHTDSANRIVSEISDLLTEENLLGDTVDDGPVSLVEPTIDDLQDDVTDLWDAFMASKQEMEAMLQELAKRVTDISDSTKAIRDDRK